jgi:hypothetical protein
MARFVPAWQAQEPAASRPLQAGPLRAEWVDGCLCHIRYGGIEILKSMAFVVRDGEGEKCTPGIGELDLRQEAGRFELSFEAVSDCEGRSLAWRVRIMGTARGLSLAAWALAHSGFRGSRAGLEILYPGSGMAGQSIQVEHVDGSAGQAVLPEPDALLQPMSQLVAIAHEPAPGLRVACRLEGAGFEMAGHGRGARGFFRLRAQVPMPSRHSLPARGRTQVQMACISFEPTGAP